MHFQCWPHVGYLTRVKVLMGALGYQQRGYGLSAVLVGGVHAPALTVAAPDFSPVLVNRIELGGRLISTLVNCMRRAAKGSVSFHYLVYWGMSTECLPDYLDGESSFRETESTLHFSSYGVCACDAHVCVCTQRGRKPTVREHMPI